MRIAVWCAARGIPLYGPSGASAHLRGITAALVRAGHDVTVAVHALADARGQDDVDAQALAGVRTVSVAVRARTRWPDGLRTVGDRLDGHRLAARLWTVGWRPELVWERHEPRSAAAMRWAGISDALRVVELDAPLSLERRWPRPPRPGPLRREHLALRRADRVVAVSRWLADWAVAEAGCAPERVVHAANGVPPQPDVDRAAARARLGVGDAAVVGFVGSMSAWQGAQVLPALLDRLGPSWRGVAIGAGPCPPAEHPRLVRAGRVAEAEVPALVAAMDVAIAPYGPGAPPWFCPLKIAAYRAQGVPIVAADLGDARHLVGDGGELLPVGASVGDWADAVRRGRARARIPWVRTWDDVAAEALAGLRPRR